MRYVCADCGRKISREELEDSKRIVCPECNSYSIRKLEDEKNSDDSRG